MDWRRGDHFACRNCRRECGRSGRSGGKPGRTAWQRGRRYSGQSGERADRIIYAAYFWVRDPIAVNESTFWLYEFRILIYESVIFKLSVLFSVVYGCVWPVCRCLVPVYRICFEGRSGVFNIVSEVGSGVVPGRS